jgi:hypothetical protein
MIAAGIIVSRIQPLGQETKLQSANTEQAAPKEVSTISEKPKIVTTKTEIIVTEEEVPYTTIQTYDGTLAKDTTVVKVEGQNGKKVVKTEVKTKDGVEVSKSLISEEVTVPPVNEVIAIGTRTGGQPRSKACDINYKPCIPKVKRDLDCDDIGIQVEILGEDVHNFDEDDQDGIGCERYGAGASSPTSSL